MVQSHYMYSDGIVNFYNSLLGIEIAIFGIICAVIFVFIQISFSTYSFKHIGHILSDKLLRLYILVSIVNIFMTSAGSFFLSFRHHDLIPFVYLYTDTILSHPYYVLSCLVLVFASVFVFIRLVVKDLSYLQPSRALFLLSKDISYESIRDYLWRKFPPEVPYQYKFRVSILDYLKKPKESKKARTSRVKKEQQELDVEQKRIEGMISAIAANVKDAEDPFLPLRDMMLQFIKKSDLSSLQEAANLFEHTADTLLDNAPKESNSWQPEFEILSTYLKHMIDNFDTLLEVSNKEGLETAKSIILNASFSISKKYCSKKRFKDIEKIGEWWQKIADNSIGKSSILFRNIIGYYQEIGTLLFKELASKTKDKEENERLLENIFRYIGWLGERLLIKLPLEESPLFSNYSYSTEYDDYYNCLMSFSDLYERDKPDLYPLIYFDALIVVMKRLVKIYKEDSKSRLNENIFSIAYSFSSFAEKAILVGNGSGASLAALRIKETYQDLKEAGLDKDARDVIKLLVRIGILAASNKEKLTQAHFMSSSLEEWTIAELSSSGEEISDEVLESHIKLVGNDEGWNYITNLGNRMGTNFGLMFDPLTRQLYASDDPRRR